ncbi:MAG: glycoside hydrolase family 127 protein [Clostridia bacterium]|nr:glycoside hydrolase family 127 protein [Clostridia bacterium]
MNQYCEKTANFNRLKTDALLMDFDLRGEFTGCIAKAFQFVHDEQVMDAALWTRFVEQFRLGDDSEKGAWRGEYWGKMMRGACFVWSYTRDDALFRMLRATVEDMMTAQDELGRISSFNKEKELFGWDMWCRKYVLLGMQYFMEINDDEELNARIVRSMCRQVDYLMGILGEGKKSIFETSQTWRGLNSSTILEPVVRLYNITGEQKYFDFASYIVGCGGTEFGNLIEMALEDKMMPYQYPVTKAYEMMSFFEGVLEYYRTTGEEKYRTAVLNYGRRIAETDITIIGSAGCTHELLDYSKVRQSDPNNQAGKALMQETCVTVTWMKFCTQLLLVSGEVEFADQVELALYNAYLGSLNTEKKVDQRTPGDHPEWIQEYMHFDSYSPLLPGSRGRQVGGQQGMRDGHYYGCCACIGAAGIGLAHKAAVLLDKDGAVLNLYIPGTLLTQTPEQRSLRLALTTDYPMDGNVRIAVMPEEEEDFVLTLRIPGWCKSATVSVNGEEDSAVSAGWLRLHRSWKAGDTVVLKMAMPTEAIFPIPYGEITVNTDMHWREDKLYPVTYTESPENKDHVAFRRGPLVLAVDARTGIDPDAPITPLLKDGEAQVRLLPPDAVPFETNLAVAVKLADGSELKMVDYASAGKTLDENSRMAAWLNTK